MGLRLRRYRRESDVTREPHFRPRMPRESNVEGVGTNGRLLDMMSVGTTSTDIHRSGKYLTLWWYTFDITIWANKSIGVTDVPLEFACPCCQGNLTRFKGWNN